jgi:succinate dehydrogenase / fumarate reductase cytochrome b subunit
MKSPLFSSSIGLKIIMGVSGALLVLFLVAHVVGNLEIFIGAEAINHYGVLLRTLPPLLWAMRAGLLILVVLHIWSALRLWAINRAARPVGYAQQRHQTTTLAARTMIWSGIILAGFVVYHILHFTVRSVQPEYKNWLDAQGHHDIFRMVTDAFRRPLVSGFYILSMILLGFHLSHGIGSMIHTLGVSHPRYNPSWRHFGVAVAVLIVVGFIAVPFAILAGVIH